MTIVRRTLRASRRLPPWWPYAIFVAITAPLTLFWWRLILDGSITYDWNVYVEAGRRAWAGSADLYRVEQDYALLHSPVQAYLFPLISWIGPVGIRLATVAAALALPVSWPIRILVLFSWPFAWDVQHGALITIVVLIAAWAVAGARPAQIIFVGWSFISPRPLMLPILAWLLWRNRWLRWPAVGTFIIHAAVVLATGYADDWARSLRETGDAIMTGAFNLSPTRYFGYWWLLAGVPLAAWLFRSGRVGLAGLAISPYLLPHYLTFSLVREGLLPSTRTVAGDEADGLALEARADANESVGMPSSHHAGGHVGRCTDAPAECDDFVIAPASRARSASCPNTPSVWWARLARPGVVSEGEPPSQRRGVPLRRPVHGACSAGSRGSASRK